jgi:hypothetical protein
MTVSRIYLIQNTKTGAERLVDAVNEPQAIRHVARDEYRANVAGQRTLVDLLARGVKVERAGETEPAP